MSHQNNYGNYHPIKNNVDSTIKVPVDGDNIIITAALPYANGEIHIGHIASTYLPADIFARYNRRIGKQVSYICGTDDYGTPVLVKAEKENKSPRDYVGFWNNADYEDFKSLGISFDFFSKTSSRENIEFVQYVFNELDKKGHIYVQDVTQFYCEHDRKFLPDRYVKGTCPVCGAENQYSDLCEKCGSIPKEILNPKCAICGRTPIKKNSQHYFFRLSAFSDKLREWLLNNNNLNSDVKNYVLHWIEKGLQDWDITRDLSWGIPIPKLEVKGKVFYGWFDNHLSYISSFLTYVKRQKKVGLDEARRAWNESSVYHFIGKDIVYHHYLFLPAVRMGIDYEYKLPDYMPTRGHLLLYDKKISKSRDWYIGLRDFLKRNNPDYLRFYLALVTPNSQADVHFDWDDFSERINNDLIDNIGNFVNRSLSFICRTYGGKVPVPGEYDKTDNDAIVEINRISQDVGEFLKKNETDRGLKRVLEFSRYFNQYFQKKQPWKSLGSYMSSGNAYVNNPNNKENEISTTLFVAVNAVSSLAILLEPFIPFSSEKIWSQLRMEASSALKRQPWKNASSLNIEPGHIIAEIKPIFQKIDIKDLAIEKSRFNKQRV
ncbi:MAG: methionine--tRNA ligase [Nitrososphaeraceae archaeon]